MPQLSDLTEKRKFVKKSFRPWDLSGTGTVDSSKEATQPNAPASAEPVAVPPAAIEEKILVKEEVTIVIPAATTQEKVDNETDNNSDNKQVTTEKHSGNKRVTPTRQPDNIKVTSRQQLDNHPDNNTGNTTDISYLTDAIKKLTGIQKNLFLYIINVCTARGALDTGNILSTDLANSANCSVGSAKTSLNRLVEKHIVIRHEGKACRGGHMVLGITKEIQAASIQAQHALFNPLKMVNPDNITSNTIGNNGSYSSSIYNNKTTTSLPDDWKKINFTALQEIGFSETQLRQLFESEASAPEIIQESINHFAYALEHSSKVKAYTDPLNVFMGVLRKGQRWHEPAYVSPKELALRQILDEKRKKKEQFDGMIKELVEMEFPEWRKNLSEDEIKQIVPADTLKTNLTPAIQAALRSYFVERILLPRLDIE